MSEHGRGRVVTAYALFVGGPADGQWRAVEAADETVTVQLPPTVTSLRGLPGDVPVPARTATYRRRVNFAVDEPEWIYDYVDPPASTDGSGREG